MNSPSQSTVDAAVDALNKVRRRWHRVPEVTATDVGFRIEGDQLTDTVALRVHVQRKRPVSELAPSEVFNEAGDQRTIDGFPVDVIEAAYAIGVRPPLALEDVAAAEVDRRSRIRPLIGGISVGNPRITAGTLGAIVFGRQSCQASLLSNFHVLAGDLTTVASETILQPGRADGGNDPADRVATLDRFRIDARMDAAVARIDPGINYDREILGVGTISGTVAPALGMQVIKSGRTTGVTEGVIDGIHTAVTVDYGGSIGVLTLTDQVHIVPRPPWPRVAREVTEGGDSGAIWLDDSTRRAVGLNFAGDASALPAAEAAICTPIDRVMAEFDITFLPVLCPPPAQVRHPVSMASKMSSSPGERHAAVARAETVLKTVRSDLMAQPGVRGTFVGLLRDSEGALTEAVGIVVIVDATTSPDEHLVPQQVAGVAVQVVPGMPAPGAGSTLSC